MKQNNADKRDGTAGLLVRGGARYPGGMIGGVPKFNQANVKYVERTNIPPDHIELSNGRSVWKDPSKGGAQ